MRKRKIFKEAWVTSPIPNIFRRAFFVKSIFTRVTGNFYVICLNPFFTRKAFLDIRFDHDNDKW